MIEKTNVSRLARSSPPLIFTGASLDASQRIHLWFPLECVFVTTFFPANSIIMSTPEEAEAAIGLFLDFVGYFLDASLKLQTKQDDLSLSFQLRVKE